MAVDGDDEELLITATTTEPTASDGDTTNTEGSSNNSNRAHDPSDESYLSCCAKQIGCCQRFNSAGWILMLLTTIAFLQSMINSGLVPVVLTSLERRFSMSSFKAGMIVSMYDLAVGIASPLVAYFGEAPSISRPRLVSYGSSLITCGSVLLTMPHFFSGEYKVEGNSDASLCKDAPSNLISCSSADSWLIMFFFLAQTMIGLGAATIYTLGITILDDSTPPQKFGTYLGYFYSLSTIGPALGFLLGGVFLGIYVEPGTATDLTPDSAAWVGAWWVPFLCTGGLLFIFTAALFSYPQYIRQTKWIREGKSEQGTDSLHGGGIVRSIIQLLKNKCFMLNNIAQSCEIFIVFGIGAFLPKLVETQFNVTASTASFFSGIAVILGACTGQMVGGYFLSRYNWGLRELARNMMVLSIAVMFMSPLLLMHCEPPTFAFVDPSTLTLGCQTTCHCNSLTFAPVCGSDGLVYFDACQAGCPIDSVDGKFTDCGCVGLSNDSPFTEEQAAEEGFCGGSCGLTYLFLFCLFVLMFTTFSMQVQAATYNLRVVADNQRSLALGLNSFIYRLVGAVPGPLIIGNILDRQCILWETTCSNERGSCWEYDNVSLSQTLVFAMVGLKIVAAVCFFLAYRAHVKNDRSDRGTYNLNPTPRENPGFENDDDDDL